MDIDVARDMLRTASRSARELQGFLAPLKERCSPHEYQSLAMGIAAAIDAISQALTNKALSSHPELKNEVETKLARHGRFD